VLIAISSIEYLKGLLLVNMQFPLPDASIMLWSLQRNQQARALRATLTQKAFHDKHKKTQ